MQSKTEKGAAALTRSLKAEGLRFFFGVPGVQNLELYASLEKEPGLRTVLIANEESAAFAAAGIFYASGGTELGCVNIIGRVNIICRWSLRRRRVPQSRRGGLVFRAYLAWEFGSTLGYPGEGPDPVVKTVKQVASLEQPRKEGRFSKSPLAAPMLPRAPTPTPTESSAASSTPQRRWRKSRFTRSWLLAMLAAESGEILTESGVLAVLQEIHVLDSQRRFFKGQGGADH